MRLARLSGPGRFRVSLLLAVVTLVAAGTVALATGVAAADDATTGTPPGVRPWADCLPAERVATPEAGPMAEEIDLALIEAARRGDAAAVKRLPDRGAGIPSATTPARRR